VSLLASDLLAYTQVAGLEREPVTPVDAGKVFEQVLRSLQSAVQESHGTVTSGPLPFVAVKETHLQQLLQNLIGNALKYCKDDEPPFVHVSATQQDLQWRFAVQDNGIGIAPEYQAQVFGIFKRLHVKGGKYAGTGIGLAICEKIVDRYRGRIWMESAVGKGTTVYFTVPAAGD
jgi:light-regulated signal transduction histidine kinase (bacteriophytochrome)